MFSNSTLLHNISAPNVNNEFCKLFSDTSCFESTYMDVYIWRLCRVKQDDRRRMVEL